MRLRTTVARTGRNTTGIPVPPEVVDELGAGKRPKVEVTVNGHTFRTSIGAVDGQPMISLSADNRTKAGVAGGDDVEVDVRLDTAPREIAVPDDLAAALDTETRTFFDGLSHSNKRRVVEPIETAKAAETRQRRITKAVAALREGKVP